MINSLASECQDSDKILFVCLSYPHNKDKGNKKQCRPTAIKQQSGFCITVDNNTAGCFIISSNTPQAIRKYSCARTRCFAALRPNALRREYKPNATVLLDAAMP